MNQTLSPKLHAALRELAEVIEWDGTGCVTCAQADVPRAQLERLVRLGLAKKKSIAFRGCRGGVIGAETVTVGRVAYYSVTDAGRAALN